MVFSKRGFLSTASVFLIVLIISFGDMDGDGIERTGVAVTKLIPEVITSVKKDDNLIFPYERHETRKSFMSRINLSTHITNVDEMLENHSSIEYSTYTDGYLGKKSCGEHSYYPTEFISINASNIESVKEELRNQKVGCAYFATPRGKGGATSVCGEVAGISKGGYQGCVDRVEGRSRGVWND